MKRDIVLSVFAVVFMLGVSFALFIPLQRSTGVLDTTLNNCTGIPKASKRYHILLGQKNDFELVSAHVVTVTDDHCGQLADFRLYL